MSSCSPERPRGLSRRQRLALGTILLALALGLPAAGLAQAGFGAETHVVIRISIAPTSPAPGPSDPAPTPLEPAPSPSSTP